MSMPFARAIAGVRRFVRPVSGIKPVIAADVEAAIFSAKTFLAAVIAYFIPLSIGFAEPIWAVTTVYLVSQPLSGAVLSKALYRLVGTFLGGAAAVILLPEFVNEPIVLSFAMALWLGLCVYIAQLDRTPRSYTFVLAGFTVGLIGFPTVETPGTIFNTAILRVQEIGIAIVVASVVHGAVWPRTVTGRLQARVAAIVRDAERWSRSALLGRRDPVLDRERRRLAADVNDIEQLSVHLAYDTAYVLPTPRVVRALQDRLSWLLPLSQSVEDRIAELAEHCGGLPPDIADLVAGIDAWLGAAADPVGAATAQDLVVRATAIGETFDAQDVWAWREMLLVNTLSRLGELVQTHRVIRELRDRILDQDRQRLTPEAAALVAAAKGRSLHRDHVLALRSALGTMIAVCVICAFWIATAWPTGGTAALIIGPACALFGGFPDADVAISQFLHGAIVGIAAAGIYAFVVFPRVTDFVMLAAVLAPFLLALGCMLVRPHLTRLALGAVIAFSFTVGLDATYRGDFAGYANGAVALLFGTTVSTVAIGIFHAVGEKTALARLFRASFRDIAARAEGRAGDMPRWTSRMIDRTVLIAARTGARNSAGPAYDALRGLRAGNAAGELHALGTTLGPGEERDALAGALGEVSRHFRRIDPGRYTPPGDAMLRAIDRALSAFAADRQLDRRRDAVELLIGLRRTLFPLAPAYAGIPA